MNTMAIMHYALHVCMVAWVMDIPPATVGESVYSSLDWGFQLIMGEEWIHVNYDDIQDKKIISSRPNRGTRSFVPLCITQLKTKACLNTPYIIVYGQSHGKYLPEEVEYYLMNIDFAERRNQELRAFADRIVQGHTGSPESWHGAKFVSCNWNLYDELCHVSTNMITLEKEGMDSLRVTTIRIIGRYATIVMECYCEGHIQTDLIEPNKLLSGFQFDQDFQFPIRQQNRKTSNRIFTIIGLAFIPIELYLIFRIWILCRNQTLRDSLFYFTYLTIVGSIAAPVVMLVSYIWQYEYPPNIWNAWGLFTIAGFCPPWVIYIVAIILTKSDMNRLIEYFVPKYSVLKKTQIHKDL